MRRKIGTALIAFSLLAMPVAADAQSAQAPGEREAQLALPASSAPLWTTLRQTKIGEDQKRGIFTASFPAAVKSLDGQTVTLSGFMLPMDTSQKSRHFLLSKYTPVCPFCPPGEPNEVVEVTSKTGVKLTDRMITVTGRLTLINDGEKGLFFRLDPAV